ncbi:GGDEF domain-containing protein [Paenibacillus sp. GCM10023248]|uniref:GGDEF domain-containing protein n=1 Tax=Bacillales TaxID=1385 RepID=UPI0023798F77|nr:MULTISPECIES: diguanylate cyclase [Bacillales]MDD9269447.1 diguanylate cyclase [Paenibacillus sp. MAHUQ-63]MDR6880937.1 diguanylate cyclase [Bacillus sp. 3255]
MTALSTIQDLISNFAIVTAYLFLANQVIFKYTNLDSRAAPYIKLKMGVVAGILGIILMIFTVHMNGTILDFRHLAIIISAIHGGIYSSVITGMIIFLMRMFAYGDVSTSTVIASLNSIVIAVGVGLICMKQRSFWRKWIYSLFISILFTGIVFILNLGANGIVPMLTFTFMMTVGGLLAGYLTNFLVKAKAQFQRFEQEATTDFLTGLNNHRSFDEKFNDLLQSAEDKSECLSILLVDIDYFKKINDTYGHANGDAVLQQLGDVLTRSSRTFDTISRIGGEEFSLLLYDTPHKHALIIAERIRMSVNKHKFMLNDGSEISITVSIGAATFPDTKREELIEQADRALYHAKRNGRNLVCSNQAES